MKLKIVLNKLSETLKKDNPLINFGDKETTEIFWARYSGYSSRGSHFVEFDFISPNWNKSMQFDPNKVCTNEIMFSRKSNALRFIKLVNNGN